MSLRSVLTLALLAFASGSLAFFVHQRTNAILAAPRLCMQVQKTK